MPHALIVLIWLVNFGISIWNAYAVGLAWVETKHCGGWPRFMAWMGAIMSASGFTWCYLILLAFVAHHMQWISDNDLGLALTLGYILLIPGILFSGTMIMLDSWARAYRTRRLSDIGLAAWNTYAELHNAYHAVNDLDKAFGSVVDALGSKSSGGKDGGAALVVIIGLVIVALLAGVITTAVIINRVAGSHPLPGSQLEEQRQKDLAQR